MRERRRNKRTRARKRLFRMYVEQQAGELSPFSILIRFPLSLVSCFFCPFICFSLSLSRFSFRFSSEVAKERQERVPVSQYLDRRSRTCPYPEIRSTRDHSGPPSTRAPCPAHIFERSIVISSPVKGLAYTGRFVSHRSVFGVPAEI